MLNEGIKTMAKTILVVDDKLSVITLVRDYLTENGFHVVTAENGREALFVARDANPDLVLLDIMMPEMDGFDFIRAYRKERDVPIILLTAKLDEMDKVIGLELGADDYITKPFGMRELVARIRAVLRRYGKDDIEADVLRVDDLIVDKSRRTVRVGSESINTLTPSEFDLLVILATTPGRVFSRGELLEQMQGNTFEGVERTVDVHVRNLRTKIEPDPATPYYIETVFGVGYRCRED